MSNESTVKPKIEAKEWWLVLEHHKTPRVLFEKPDEIYETDVHVIEAQPALARIAELEAQNHRQLILISQLANECNDKETINAKLKACVAFYADVNNWGEDVEGYARYIIESTDTGKTARTTLAEVAELEQKDKGEE